MMSFVFKLAVAATLSAADVALDDQADHVSLLQLRVQKANATLEDDFDVDEDQRPENMCRSGIRVRNICYDRRCGSTGQTPGGRNCAALPGGANACCMTRITRPCTGPNMDRCRCVAPPGMGKMGMGMGKMGMGMGKMGMGKMG